jgi:hypothetical protein
MIQPAASELPNAIRYVQALGPTLAAFVAAVIASVIQYRMWRLSNDKIRLDLFDRRMKIYNALHFQFQDGSGNVDVVILNIDFVIKELDGYKFSFGPEAVKIITSIETRLIMLGGTLQSDGPYADGLHRFILNAMHDIAEESYRLTPLLVKQLAFIN